MKEINWDETNTETKNALKDATAEIEKAKFRIKNIDCNEIKKSLEQAKIEMKKSKAEFKKIDMNKMLK